MSSCNGDCHLPSSLRELGQFGAILAPCNRAVLKQSNLSEWRRAGAWRLPVMSQMGQQRTWRDQITMSAIPPKEDNAPTAFMSTRPSSAGVAHTLVRKAGLERVAVRLPRHFSIQFCGNSPVAETAAGWAMPVLAPRL